MCVPYSISRLTWILEFVNCKKSCRTESEFFAPEYIPHTRIPVPMILKNLIMYHLPSHSRNICKEYRQVQHQRRDILVSVRSFLHRIFNNGSSWNGQDLVQAKLPSTSRTRWRMAAPASTPHPHKRTRLKSVLASSRLGYRAARPSLPWSSNNVLSQHWRGPRVVLKRDEDSLPWSLPRALLGWLIDIWI